MSNKFEITVDARLREHLGLVKYAIEANADCLLRWFTVLESGAIIAQIDGLPSAKHELTRRLAPLFQSFWSDAVRIQFDMPDVVGCLESITNYGLTMRVLTFNGPAGGNPLVEICGPLDQIRAWALEHYYGSNESDASEDFEELYASQAEPFFWFDLTRED